MLSLIPLDNLYHGLVINACIDRDSANQSCFLKINPVIVLLEENMCCALICNGAHCDSMNRCGSN